MCDVNLKFDKNMSRKMNGQGKAIFSRKQKQNQNFSYHRTNKLQEQKNYDEQRNSRNFSCKSFNKEIKQFSYKKLIETRC